MPKILQFSTIWKKKTRQHSTIINFSIVGSSSLFIRKTYQLASSIGPSSSLYSVLLLEYLFSETYTQQKFLPNLPEKVQHHHCFHVHCLKMDPYQCGPTLLGMTQHLFTASGLDSIEAWLNTKANPSKRCGRSLNKETFLGLKENLFPKTTRCLWSIPRRYFIKKLLNSINCINPFAANENFTTNCFSIPKRLKLKLKLKNNYFHTK